MSGDVTVLLDVQPNDDTIAGISLTLGEQVIHCRGTSSDQGDGFIAAASGQLEVECLFKTASVMGECAGAQLPPLFANGEHTLGARITTADGETREAIVTQPVTLKNTGFVMVEHSAGSASAVKTGVTYHGGPGRRRRRRQPERIPRLPGVVRRHDGRRALADDEAHRPGRDRTRGG